MGRNSKGACMYVVVLLRYMHGRCRNHPKRLNSDVMTSDKFQVGSFSKTVIKYDR